MAKNLATKIGGVIDLIDKIMPSAATVTYWVAKDPTYVKASEKLARDLPNHEKLAVKPGAYLTARLVEENRGYWIVSDGTIDGKSIPSNLRFLYKPNWTLISVLPIETKPQQVTLEATPLQSLEDRISIRSYELWERDGRPDDRSDYYWYRAACEVEAEDDMIRSR